MSAALFDTNILIDTLRGIAAGRDELARWSERAISRITWIEVLIGATEAIELDTRAFLNDFRVIELDEEVSEHAVRLRRELKLRLPDAVILATAEAAGLMLVTRNTRDFPVAYPNVRVPYSV